jgi:hypothetical protein
VSGSPTDWPVVRSHNRQSAVEARGGEQVSPVGQGHRRHDHHGALEAGDAERLAGVGVPLAISEFQEAKTVVHSVPPTAG